MKHHTSILLKEVLDCLDIKKDDVVLDGTYGFGGHSGAIVKKLGPSGQIIGFEQDKEIYKKVKPNISEKIKLVNDNFVNYRKHLKKLGIKKIDKALFDLGVSSWHFDASGRGFSFLKNEKLDMRMDQKMNFTAKDVINKYKESELADIFFFLADEHQSRKIAKEIVSYREKKEIESSAELAQIVARVKKVKGRIHPATKVFQALRIEVNSELSVIKKTLENIVLDTARGGKICVISFHSKEDRVVKNVFKQYESEKLLDLVNKKPILPTREEIRSNPRSRSAKMRVVEIKNKKEKSVLNRKKRKP